MRVNLDPTTNTSGNQTLKTIAMALFALGVVMVLADDNTVEKQARVDANYYCEMVYLFITSNGENGFPDYKSQYGKNCEGPIVKPSLEF